MLLHDVVERDVAGQPAGAENLQSVFHHPQEFVAKWKRATVAESAAAQTHFNDLCALLGEPTPIEADSAGTLYAFEANVVKITGGMIRAVVLVDGYVDGTWQANRKGRRVNVAVDPFAEFSPQIQAAVAAEIGDIQRFLGA